MKIVPILQSMFRKRDRPRRRMRPAILVYHRVIGTLLHDPWELAVTPEHFEEQIAYIKRYRSPMSMKDVLSKLRTHTLPDDAVAITFDDGYRDNLYNAAPILVHHRVPATFFIATGYTHRQEPFWWDELAEMILESTTAVHYKFDNSGDPLLFDWQEVENADLSATWRGWDEPETARQRSYVDTWQRLQNASQQTRDETMAALRTVLPVRSDRLALPMTTSELQNLIGDNILTLGAHTTLHPSLTKVKRQECRFEMSESKHECERVAGANVDGFAYPYGHVNPDVREDAASTGFAWACSTERSFLDQNPNIHALPRIAVANIGTARFAETIKGE